MPNPNPQTYSFADVHAAIVGPGGGGPLGSGSGVDEEGITVEFAEEADQMTIGADGSAQHNLNPSKAGVVTIRLLKTSIANAMLSALYSFQRGSAATWGQNVLTITDVARGDDYTCQQGAFQKHAPVTWSKNPKMNEWRFNFGVIDPLLGVGSPAAGANG